MTHKPTEWDMQTALDRWELDPNDPDCRHDLTGICGFDVDSVFQALNIWQSDHPDWNPDADLKADARAIFAAFTQKEAQS